MPPKYEFIVADDGSYCEIFLLKPRKKLGKVFPAPGGRSRQEFADDVMWLPIYDALEAMGDITKEESIHGKLGY